jgi:TRAP-type C4-dicarboxylate transport system permease small subunit
MSHVQRAPDGSLPEKLGRWLHLVMAGTTVVCLGTLFVLVSAMVFVRFVPLTSLAWADEIVELAFAWLVFLGAAVLWRDGGHFRVDLLPKRLEGSRAGQVLDVGLTLLALGFLLFFTYQSFTLTWAASDRSPTLELPKYLWYAVMPLAGAVMLGYSLRDLWLRVRPHKAGRPGTVHD